MGSTNLIGTVSSSKPKLKKGDSNTTLHIKSNSNKMITKESSMKDIKITKSNTTTTTTTGMSNDIENNTIKTTNNTNNSVTTGRNPFERLL